MRTYEVSVECTATARVFVRAASPAEAMRVAAEGPRAWMDMPRLEIVHTQATEAWQTESDLEREGRWEKMS